MLRPRSALPLMVLLLAACSASTPQKDQRTNLLTTGSGIPVLAPDQGILSLVIQVEVARVGSLVLEREDSGEDLSLGSLRQGEYLVLLPASAGEWCFDPLSLGALRFAAEVAEQGVCMTVTAGHISYGGHLRSRARAGSALTSRRLYDEIAFRERMELERPDLLAVYPLAEANFVIDPVWDF